MNKRLGLFISLLLGLLTFAIFWPVTWHEFLTYDDGLYVTDNLWVQAGLTLQGTAWALQTSDASNWHPVTWLSHMLDCSVFDLFAGGHHLTSLMLHVANTVLLFLLLKRMTGAVWRSALVAALFAWHPLHVESVAWIAERKDLLSTLFWILCVWAYVRYVERPGPARYLVALGLFALGLMAKPMVVTLPFVLLLLDYWPLGRLMEAPAENVTAPHGGDSARPRWVGLLKEKVPFFALSAALCLVTIWAQHKGGALRSLDAMPFSLRVSNALTAYAAYLWKMLWPSDLAVFYPMPSHVPLWAASSAGLVLAAVSVCAVCVRRRHPAMLVGWLWYLGTLVPVIGLVQVGAQAMADRYTYVPLIGIFILVAWGLGQCWSRAGARPVKLAFAGLALAAFASVTVHQLQYWRDSETLFEHVVQVTRTNPVTHAAFGIALSAQGRTAAAIEQYSEALRLKPDYCLAHVNLAAELAGQGKEAEAAAHLTEVLRLKPEDAGAHNSLGVLLAKQGLMQSAMDQFNIALRIKPEYLNGSLNLALAHSKQGKTAEAIACYRAALQLQPRSPEPLDKLAWIMATHPDAQFRDGPGAVRLARQALELTRPPQPGYLDTLAAAYAEAGLFKEAIATEQEALRSVSTTGAKELTAEFQNRLQLYLAGRAYRDME